jgi:Asp-tRNA(Asn)/Glu-tRNA(Gln) amidotransferase A subunit family amidase
LTKSAASSRSSKLGHIDSNAQLGETTNPVFGLTTNPHNRDLTCGGSSGGEGALIAMKGSPLGVGTDMWVLLLAELEVG